MESTGISARELGRRIGVSHTSILKAHMEGRVSAERRTKGKKTVLLFDPVEAERQYLEGDPKNTFLRGPSGGKEREARPMPARTAPPRNLHEGTNALLSPDESRTITGIARGASQIVCARSGASRAGAVVESLELIFEHLLGEQVRGPLTPAESRVVTDVSGSIARIVSAQTPAFQAAALVQSIEIMLNTVACELGASNEYQL